MEYCLNPEIMKRFEERLLEEEKCSATIHKYMRDLRAFASAHAGERVITKETVIRYKQNLIERYKATTVNGVLASLNCFFKKMEWYDCIVKSLRIQREAFRSEERELSREEYYRLVHAAKAKGKTRLYYLLQTLCSTGIRVSELRFVTVEAVKCRRAYVSLKGKNRVVLLPAALCKALGQYVKETGLKSGSVFVTRNGNVVDRSNIFREMKALCADADVDRAKVFPHNLRHLFACIYYKEEKDIAHLADILGHSSIETTRIYLVRSWEEQGEQMEKLKLVV